MKTVMARRNLLLAVVVLVVCVVAWTGTASASMGTAKPAVETPVCLIHSLHSFVAQGEFPAEHSSVADLIEVECKSVYAQNTVAIAARELANRCPLTWIHGHSPVAMTAGPNVKGLKLDDAGNVEVALVAGPSCASGEVLVSAHLEQAPYQTFTTSYSILGPTDTTSGLEVNGATGQPKQVADAFDSSVFAIAQVEYPSVDAGLEVEVIAEELYSSCKVAPKLLWFTGGATLQKVEKAESVKLKLDNNGNAFALVDAEESCAHLNGEFLSVLLAAPGTRFTSMFEVESPHETF
jgi:hypothetical protein